MTPLHAQSVVRRLIQPLVVVAAVLLPSTAMAQNGPILTLTSATVFEGNAGTRVISLPVSFLFGGSNATVITGNVTATAPAGLFANPATGGAACTAGVDFIEFVNVPFSISAGATNESLAAGNVRVSITVCGDTTIEPNQSFAVSFTNVVGAVCTGDGSCFGTATILNDDGPPSIRINNISVSEPVIGTKGATFTVSLSHASTTATTMNFTTRDGTARARCVNCQPAVVVPDYEPKSGTLSIAAGALSGSISVAILGGAANESDETFFVDLSGAVGGTFADNSGRATIRDTALSIGGFEFSPDGAQATPGEMLTLAVDWTVPPHQVWRNLRTIDLRLRGAHDTALWLRWDEASNLFSLCERVSNSAAQGAAHDDNALPSQAAICGPGALPGSLTILATPYALLHLAATSVQGSGPQGPFVTLKMGLTMIGKSAGHDYKVELAAADDFGNEDRFVRAGALSVSKPK